MILAFWLAVHIESLQITKFMINKSSMLKRLVASACDRLDPKEDIKEDFIELQPFDKDEKITSSKLKFIILYRALRYSVIKK